MENIDQKIDELIEVVKAKKQQIADLGKPKWNTHCSFSFSHTGRGNDNTNLQVVVETKVLVNIAAFLKGLERDVQEANQFLGTNVEPTWQGYKTTDWLEDVKFRLGQITIKQKKQELEILEKRLDNLMSADRKRQLELEEIEKSLLG